MIFYSCRNKYYTNIKKNLCIFIECGYNIVENAGIEISVPGIMIWELVSVEPLISFQIQLAAHLNIPNSELGLRYSTNHEAPGILLFLISHAY